MTYVVIVEWNASGDSLLVDVGVVAHYPLDNNSLAVVAECGAWNLGAELKCCCSRLNIP